MEELTYKGYTIYWDNEEQIIYIYDPVRVRDLYRLRYWLIVNGYRYKNFIIGRQ